MDEYTEQELKKSIEQKQFSSVYFLIGEEKMLMEKAVKKLIEQATGEQFLEFNHQSFDGAFVEVEEIVRAAEGLPFMSEYKCVTVSDFNIEKRSVADIDAIKELLKDPPKSCILIFYLPNLNFNEKRPGKWGSFITAVKKVGVVVSFQHKTKAELEKLLCAAAKKRGCTLSWENAGRIIFLSGSDLQTLYNETEKLCAYTMEGEITRETIELCVVRNFETTVFLLANALVGGDYNRAYTLLDILFYQNEEPIAILAVLGAAYVDMYRVRACVQGGQSALVLVQDFDYKGKEFKLKYAERDSANLSVTMLRQSLQLLLEADIALKSARTEGRLILEQLLAKLRSVAGKEEIY